MSTTPSPRSCLSVPGSSHRMIEKALASAADEVVIDLEDAVAINAKAEARSITTLALAQAPAGRRVAVRVNAVGTPWCHSDLIALGSSARAPDSIVIPKVDTVGDVAFAERLLTGVARATGNPAPGIQVLIESASGLLEAPAIAKSSPHVEALILGYADLSADLGRKVAAAPWSVARERVVWAARAAGIRAVDGPYLDVADDADFRSALADAVATGFDAKWVIHPQQIDAVNAALTPTREELDWAREVLDALEAGRASGVGSVALNGAMLDEAVAVAARRTLAKGGVR